MTVEVQNTNMFMFDWKLRCPHCGYENTIPGRYSKPERMKCYKCKKEFKTDEK